ncbi:hypothetical protein ACF07Z_12095 [Streptomyces albidoflavus]|uniref:hypothetical protein n=1 Tax=Streptomyces albidoflavus TaxID=1886 RepID=UPI001022492E|nr:hypothetical protein [Streptomyces albidoflavus]
MFTASPPREGRPLSLIVTAGQRADCTPFEPAQEVIRVLRTGPGGVCKKPASVVADKAYSNSPCLTSQPSSSGSERDRPDRSWTFALDVPGLLYAEFAVVKQAETTHRKNRRPSRKIEFRENY